MEISQLLPPQAYDSDPLFDFEAALEEAAHALDLEPWVLQRLKHPEREVTVNLPLARDDGSTVNVTGYRVQHSRAHGPSIGPVALSAAAHAAGLRINAAQITLQSALLGLRLGGAAGALVIDEEKLSERELRHLIKDYVVALRENTGPLSDVLAPEGNDTLAAWMDEAATMARGQSEPAAIVGKPGTGDLHHVAADAVVNLIQYALGCDNVAGLRVALQGFGRHGRDLANVLHCRGAHLVAIADRSGGLVRDSSIDVPGLNAFVNTHGVLYGFPEAEAATNADVLESMCDALVLVAAEGQIGIHNATHVRARLVLELTQGAVTAAGAESLPSTSLLVPHLLAGAAQLAIWTHEWQRGLSYSAPDPKQAKAEASALVLHAFDSARRMAAERGVPLRSAALMLAVTRLASSLRHR